MATIENGGMRRVVSLGIVSMRPISCVASCRRAVTADDVVPLREQKKRSRAVPASDKLAGHFARDA